MLAWTIYQNMEISLIFITYTISLTASYVIKPFSGAGKGLMFFLISSDDFLFGTSADVYMLQNESPIPTKLMLKGKIHFIGRILQFLEVIK